MKKSLLALAVLGAYVGVASAQSSVTLYGTIDLNGRYVKNDGSKRRFSMGQDGINSSQLGFRGVEDLGGGLKASFVLLSTVNADTGNVAGKFFNRRSTVSLSSNAGELRLGRDYVPTFWNHTLFDAFGANGLGNSTNVDQLGTHVRQDNSIGYFLPADLGGFYGQAMVGAPEGGTSLDRSGRYLGGRVGFAAGPFDVAVAASRVKYTTGFANVPVGVAGPVGYATLAGAGDRQTSINVGGSWNFGFMKLMGYVGRERFEDQREYLGSVSAVVPFGQSEVHVGYDRSKRHFDGGGNTVVDQIKASYVYNLSKRTALYATASYLDNHDATNFSIAVGPNSSSTSSITAFPAARGESKGVEFGVRHFF
jgi:predicted porin